MTMMLIMMIDEEWFFAQLSFVYAWYVVTRISYIPMQVLVLQPQLRLSRNRCA